MVTAFAVCAVIGVLVLIASLVMGDFGFGSHVDVPGLPWLSAPALAAGVGVFGVVGWPLAAGTSLSTGAVVLISAAAGVGAYGLLMVVLRAMRHAQTGTVAGLRAAVGRPGTVTMAIPAGGWGQVSYLDAESVRATTNAVLVDGAEALADGAHVLIVDVEDDRLVVEPLRLQP